MNIIYIHTHDTGRYISPYGYDVCTPNLAKFASKCLKFDNCHTVNPTCSASRASMLTGKYPTQNGMLGLAHFGYKLSALHFAQHLSNNNYKTVLCGVQHETLDLQGKELGYQEVYQYNNDHDFDTYDEYATHKAIEFLDKVQEQPFFLSVGYMNTHRDFPKEFEQESEVRVPSILGNSEEVKKDYSAFLESAKRMDKFFGKVMAKIEQKGLFEKSIIIFTTDHGIAFPMMKCNLTSHGTGVSLLMHAPNNTRKGQSTQALISQIDLIPTLCELVKIPEPKEMEGKSFAQLFSQEIVINDYIFSQINYHVAYQPQRAVRSKDYLLIKDYSRDHKLPPSNTDAGQSKSYFYNKKFYEQPLKEYQLYCLQNDTNECDNVAYNSQYQNVLKDLSQTLENKLIQIKDPILTGKVSRPPNTKSYTRECFEIGDDFIEPNQ